MTAAVPRMIRKPLPELTLAEAASVLGLTTATLRQQRRKGKFRAVKRAGSLFTDSTEVRRYARSTRRDNAGRWGADHKWLVPPSWHEHHWRPSGPCYDARCAEQPGGETSE